MFTPSTPTADEDPEASRLVNSPALSISSQISVPNSPFLTSPQNGSVAAASPAPSFSWIQRTSTPFTGQSPAPFPPSEFSEHNIDATYCRGNEQYQQHPWGSSADERLGTNTTRSDHPSTAPENPRISIQQHSPGNSPELNPATAMHLESDIGNVSPSDSVFDQPASDHAERHSDQVSEKNLTSIQERRCFQGKEEECREHLAAAELEHGPESKETLNAIAALARVFQKQGRYKSAESLFRQVVEASQKNLGNNHRKTINAFVDLGNVFVDQGRYQSAEKLLRQVLTVLTKTMGKEDGADTIFTKRSLAVALNYQNRYLEASEIQRGVLEASQRKWGFEHMNTLRAMMELANSLSMQDHHSFISVMLYGHVLATQNRTLGEDHEDTIRTKLHLSVSLAEEGQLKDGEVLAREVLKARKRIFGSEHPEVLAA